VQEQLNERQKKMTALLVKGEELTSQKCEKIFHVTRQAVQKDFKKLVTVGIAQPMGAGRSTRYVLKTRQPGML
jgi:Fic family protein